MLVNLKKCFCVMACGCLLLGCASVQTQRSLPKDDWDDCKAKMTLMFEGILDNVESSKINSSYNRETIVEDLKSTLDENGNRRFTDNEIKKFVATLKLAVKIFDSNSGKDESAYGMFLEIQDRISDFKLVPVEDRETEFDNGKFEMALSKFVEKADAEKYPKDEIQQAETWLRKFADAVVRGKVFD